ncbi:hypothetical protein KSS87_021301 [Heliosperma pusillum]|nr:hypothetical protein KSS87_021301 [Heliosperma pusillum]
MFIFYSFRFYNRAVCLSKQKYSEVAFRLDKDDQKRGFTVAHMLPSDQGLLCITDDQQFQFYSALKHSEETLQLSITKRLIGYNENILDMKFVGEDESFLAVATNIEQVHVYDLASMSCSYVLGRHSNIVLCLDTYIGSSGNTYIVTGSKDKDVRLWYEETRKCVGVGIGHQRAVGAIAFSKKKRNFFGSYTQSLIWSFEALIDDSDKPYRLKTKGSMGAHKKDINFVAISPDDSFVFSGSEDRTARLFKLPELVEVASLVGHKQGIWSFEYSPVDPCVLTASADKTIKLWSVRDHSCLKTFEGHISSVLRASFISQGEQLVSNDDDGLLKLWSVKSNECIASYDQHENKSYMVSRNHQRSAHLLRLKRSTFKCQDQSRPTLTMSPTTNTDTVVPNPHETSKTLTSFNLTQCVKLNSLNYTAWRFQLTNILFGFSLLGFINGTKTPPSQTITDVANNETPNPAYLSWLKQDGLIIGALMGTLTAALQRLIVRAYTAKEA